MENSKLNNCYICEKELDLIERGKLSQDIRGKVRRKDWGTWKSIIVSCHFFAPSGRPVFVCDECIPHTVIRLIERTNQPYAHMTAEISWSLPGEGNDNKGS